MFKANFNRLSILFCLQYKQIAKEVLHEICEGFPAAKIPAGNGVTSPCLNPAGADKNVCCGLY